MWPHGLGTHQVLLSMGFSRQEYWSGLPCPPPGGLPDLGIEPIYLLSPAMAGRFFTQVPPIQRVTSHFSIVEILDLKDLYVWRQRETERDIKRDCFNLFRLKHLRDEMNNGTSIPLPLPSTDGSDCIWKSDWEWKQQLRSDWVTRLMKPRRPRTSRAFGSGRAPQQICRVDSELWVSPQWERAWRWGRR